MQVGAPLLLVLSAAALGGKHVQSAQVPLPVDPMHAVAGYPGVVAGSVVRAPLRCTHLASNFFSAAFSMLCAGPPCQQHRVECIYCSTLGHSQRLC